MNFRSWIILTPIALAACGGSAPTKNTLAQLRNVKPDTQEVTIEDGLDRAMESYKRYLTETRKSAMTPEAMRRLADLKIEKEFGSLDDAKKIVDVAAKEDAPERAKLAASGPKPQAAGIADLSESQKEFERRATQQATLAVREGGFDAAALAGVESGAPSGPLEAIALYDKLLVEYPNYEHNDKVLYQKSRAYDELGRTEEAIQALDKLIAEHPASRYVSEAQFRRAEYFFTRRKFRDAENAYAAVAASGDRSEYFELALYKLGWTLYKQDFYDEALNRFLALLDHKVSIGYDFDAKHEEGDERRISDTFRVISLSFSNLGGGADVINEYFATNGRRGYEDRIYSNLAEFYLTKLRYHDAAAIYKSFVGLYPFHRTSPNFSMRVIEIYSKGGFHKLVLEGKKDFAKTYGLKADYWRHFSPNEMPAVLSYLKTNLTDLASYYHAQYQQEKLVEERPANFKEALHWYREYLESFPKSVESAPINYQLADLLLEEKRFGEAAVEYERTAYDYPAHEKAAAAGYAAIYSHRENLKIVSEAQRSLVKRDAIASSLRFADAFQADEHAPGVLGAAADDLYELKDFRPAIAAAQKLIDRYPATDVRLKRSAWIVVAHASFDLDEYPQAEVGYARVLELLPKTDDKRQGFVENLAASIYKQGEHANAQQDYRAAANHFLRIKQVASSATKICAAAEYDAAAALIRLEDWLAAADVLEDFRRTYPNHELVREATKQVAMVYRKSGQLARAAGEYERIAAESDNAEMKGEALRLAGDLYQQANEAMRAMAVYQRYVNEFPHPIELAVETRFKMADMHKAANDEVRYREQLQKIVSSDAAAGSERTARVRYLAARSALVLADQSYRDFEQVKLTQPFDKSLKLKRERMNAAVKTYGALVDYEVGEVTAAATFFLAEIYYDFNRSLMESERPSDLSAADLEEYNLQLEDTAFPFEEKAIGIHEKNLELMRVGIYNAWIEKSLDKLYKLLPARYAKDELSSGFLGSIDRYAYREPAAIERDQAAAASAAQQADASGSSRVDATMMAAGVGNAETQ